jgi:hypothetical protein
MENVCNLKSYIKDTTELLQNLNKIPQPLPGNSITKSNIFKTQTVGIDGF